jgi:uncharacterized membrane protein (DUF373 family)
MELKTKTRLATPPELTQKPGFDSLSLVNKYTRIIIKVIIILLAMTLLYSLIEFIFIIGKSMVVSTEAFKLSSDPYNRDKLFISQVQGLISAVLLLTILIELINSLVEYLKIGNSNYVMIIVEIALIAIARHILAIDLEHIQPGILLGLSSLIFVLGLFFIIIKWKIKLLSNV